MDDAEKISKELIEEFFRQIPELSQLRKLNFVELQIDISYMLFFGRVVVLVAKATSKLAREGKTKLVRTSAENLLTKILTFLEDCLQSEDIRSDNPTVQDSVNVQAGGYFTETLYLAGDEYQAIVDLAPNRLRTDISRVEKYYGIPKAEKQREYSILHKAIREILSTNGESIDKKSP
jgi:hypothetical protein